MSSKLFEVIDQESQGMQEEAECTSTAVGLFPWFSLQENLRPFTKHNVLPFISSYSEQNITVYVIASEMA